MKLVRYLWFLIAVAVIAVIKLHNTTLGAGDDDDNMTKPSIADERAIREGAVVTGSAVPGGAHLPADNVRFYCMQTKKATAWCRMLHSASYHGISVHHYNWGDAYTHAKRIKWVINIVKNLPDEQVVAFNDGTDVLFAGGGEQIGARFNSLEAKWGKSLFFNAEKSCYAQQAFPDGRCSKDCKWALKKARCITTYRNSMWRNGTADLSKWRYLNAGCFIGRAGAVKTFFSRVAKITFRSDGVTLLPGVWCDQSMITKTLLANPDLHSTVGLDIENRIYLPTYHLHPVMDFCPSSSLHTCHNPHPPETPLIYHLNGKSGGVLSSYSPNWTEPVDTSMRFHYIQGEKRSLASLCGQ